MAEIRNFTDEVKEIISYSREEALRLSNSIISEEHIILAIIRHPNNNAFNYLGKR